MTREATGVGSLFDSLGFEEFAEEFADSEAISQWWATAAQRAIERLEAHGDWPRWRSALLEVPVSANAAGLGAHADFGEMPSSGEREPTVGLEAALRRLGPWRKGPYRLYAVPIDAEWRCYLKWRRVQGMSLDFAGSRVLDVGAGNGYFSLRLLEAGARFVTALEPGVLSTAQYLAVARCLAPRQLAFLPVSLEDLPRSEAFDWVLSMGVLYHRRAPLDHLRALRDALRPGGQLLLETLCWRDETREPWIANGRYAGMRNVWAIPNRRTLSEWLTEAGFDELIWGPIVRTTSDEQRATSWTSGPSLVAALDPSDPTLTLDGSPAPERALLTARRPAP